jgi:D-glycero-beta-D-manno-heptose-7-phosphate kinase
MKAKKILALRPLFARRRILVVGDVMLDHYIHGDVARISPEAPVPVLDRAHEHHVPGGAANVARNLAALGTQVELVGVVGRDPAAGTLREIFAEARIGCGGLVAEKGRPTTQKTRVVAGRQQLLRIDNESRDAISAGSRRAVIAAVHRQAAKASAIILGDYAKGVFDQEVVDAILAIGREQGVPVCIDPKPTRPLRMQGAALLTPNRKETFELAGMHDQPIAGDPMKHAGLQAAIAEIQRRHEPKALLVTLGGAGMLLIEQGKAPRHLPTMAQEVYDVSGAGDTVIATFVLARAAGLSAYDAAVLANLAAGVVVGKLGTATATVDELAAHSRD